MNRLFGSWRSVRRSTESGAKELVQSVDHTLLIGLRQVGVTRRSQNARLDSFGIWQLRALHAKSLPAGTPVEGGVMHGRADAALAQECAQRLAFATSRHQE